jgi:hypothetical protein
MRLARPLFAAGMALAATACHTANRSGRVSAGATGDLSAPLAARGPMDRDRVEQCGTGEPTAAGVEAFRRTPYLQRVDAQGASVLFTVGEGLAPATATRVGELVVKVTAPDGSPITEALGEEDASARPASAVQVRARLDDLDAATLYCYQVFDGDRPLTARTGFRTAPEAGDTSTPFGFVVFGDSGGATDDQRSVLQQVFTVDHDFVLHTGDIAYDRGSLAQFEQKHFAIYESLFRMVPHFPTPGNHEYHTTNAAPYLEVFELPENGDPRDPERYYSFDWGPIHFVSIDSNRLDDAEEQWLTRDLAATDQPFIVAYDHHPAFSSGEHGSDGDVQARVVPHLVENGAQLMFSGHDHDYERTKEMDGVTYVVAGGGGVGTRPTSRSSFTEFSSEVLHFVYVEYDGHDLVLHAIDASGQEFDNHVMHPR